MANARMIRPTYASVAQDRERMIIRHDYLIDLEGRTVIYNQITERFIQENRPVPTIGDPFGRRGSLIEIYERVFGNGDRLEWQALQQKHESAYEETARIRDDAIRDMLNGQILEQTDLTELAGIGGQTLDQTYEQIEQTARRAGMFNTGMARRIPDRDDQIDAMTKMDNMWKPPEPTLFDLLVKNLPVESMDIIGETGEEYELNVVQSLGFIIDMYRQFTNHGENKVLSGINLELSKLKEKSDGYKPNAGKHKQRDEADGAGQERFPPF